MPAPPSRLAKPSEAREAVRLEADSNRELRPSAGAGCRVRREKAEEQAERTLPPPPREWGVERRRLKIEYRRFTRFLPRMIPIYPNEIWRSTGRGRQTGDKFQLPENYPTFCCF